MSSSLATSLQQLTIESKYYYVPDEARERYGGGGDIVLSQLVLGSGGEEHACTYEELLSHWQYCVDDISPEVEHQHGTATLFRKVYALIEKGIQPLVDKGVFAVKNG